MELYLVQHGEAKSKAEDPQRPLTKRGREEVQRVAAFAAKAGLEISQVRHSGKRRAEETASILAEHLSPTEGVLAISGLAPVERPADAGRPSAFHGPAGGAAGHGRPGSLGGAVPHGRHRLPGGRRR
jgi:phosphohistidine phosphatase SixA